MTKVMTPSTITDSQVGKVVELLSVKLRKSGFRKDTVQYVLETQGKELAEEFLAMFQVRVDAQCDLITRTVTPDCTRTPAEVLDATNRRQYTTKDVVAQMPKGKGDEVEVGFFKLDCWISYDDLEKEYAKRGLKPADPYSHAQVNIDDPTFADKHPNGSHWQDSNGRWCYSAFYRWFDERRVDVSRSGSEWDAYWWFAGLRK